MGKGAVFNKSNYRKSITELIQFVSILTVGVEGVMDYLNGYFDDRNKPTKCLLSKVLLENVTFPQFVTTLPTFYGTQSFFTMFKMTSSILSQMTLVSTLDHYFLNNHFNIILPSMSRFSM
jgi:hypothetical protein